MLPTVLAVLVVVETIDLPDSNHRSEAVLEHSRRSGGRRRDVVHSEHVAVLVAASRHGHAELEEHVLGRLPAGKITD